MPTIALDDYLVTTLMRDLVGHDRSAAAYLVYLLLWSKTQGVRKRSVTMSYSELGEHSGLSKSAAQRAVARLIRRGLISASRATETARPVYRVFRPWRRGGGATHQEG